MAADAGNTRSSCLSSSELILGTSNTTVGVSASGEARLLPLERDHQTLPSAIFFDFASKSPFCGRAAREHYLAGSEGRYMQSLKSILGSSLIDEKTRIQSKPMSFADILGVFFAFLKKKMESELGHEVTLSRRRPPGSFRRWR